MLSNPRKFEELYDSISEAILPTITNISGCHPPCSYLEYRFNDDPIILGVSMSMQYIIEENKDILLGIIRELWLCLVEHVTKFSG